MPDILACRSTQVYHITSLCIFIPCLLWTFQCWWWLYKWFALCFLAATWRTCESEARTILSCSGKNVACSRVFLKKNKSSPHHATTMLTLILFGRYQISLISMMSRTFGTSLCCSEYVIWNYLYAWLPNSHLTWLTWNLFSLYRTRRPMKLFWEC